MKNTSILYILILCTLICGCGMQKFSIGETSGPTINQDKRKCVHLFWGVIPIGRKQTFPASSDAKGYVIITRHNTLDYIVTGLTGGLIMMKTVKFEAKK